MWIFSCFDFLQGWKFFHDDAQGLVGFKLELVLGYHLFKFRDLDVDRMITFRPTISVAQREPHSARKISFESNA